MDSSWISAVWVLDDPVLQELTWIGILHFYLALTNTVKHLNVVALRAYNHMHVL